MLIVLDNAYMARFWTSYECFLAMRSPSIDDGGMTAVIEEEMRADFVTMLNAEPEDVDVFRHKWWIVTPKQAYRKLSQDDIAVTNHSDKVQQLKKLKMLPDQFQHYCEQANLRRAGVRRNKCLNHLFGFAKRESFRFRPAIVAMVTGTTEQKRASLLSLDGEQRRRSLLSLDGAGSKAQSPPTTEAVSSGPAVPLQEPLLPYVAVWP